MSSLRTAISDLAATFVAGVLDSIRGACLEDLLMEAGVGVRRGPGRPKATPDDGAAPARATRSTLVRVHPGMGALSFADKAFFVNFGLPAARPLAPPTRLDWGLYVLDYNQWADRGDAMAEEKVVEKIQQLMDPTKRDPYFFLGNTKGHSHSFMIVGLFHPPRETEKKPKKGDTPTLPGIE